MAKPSPFVGFEEPPDLKPDGPSWKDRVVALAQPEFIGQWAKYGPVASKNVASTIRTAAEQLDLSVVVDVKRVDEYMYIRVRSYDEWASANGQTNQGTDQSHQKNQDK